MRKVQILDTAEQLFSERGYHATSMRDLAERLELRGGSLYSHISGKEELLWRVLERAASDFSAAIGRAETLDGDAMARLHAAIRGHVAVIAESLDAATVYFHEWKHLTEPTRDRFRTERDDYERRFRALVAAALPDADAKWATLLILSSTNWLYHWYDPAGPLTPTEIAERLTAMLIHGLE